MTIYRKKRGYYARGDFSPDSDIDIMILVDLTDMEIKDFRHRLSEITYDFNEKYDLDIKPIAKSNAHFKRWLGAYPFYTNVQKEGVGDGSQPLMSRRFGVGHCSLCFCLYCRILLE